MRFNRHGKKKKPTKNNNRETVSLAEDAHCGELFVALTGVIPGRHRPAKHDSVAGVRSHKQRHRQHLALSERLVWLLREAGVAGHYRSPLLNVGANIQRDLKKQGVSGKPVIMVG